VQQSGGVPPFGHAGLVVGGCGRVVGLVVGGCGRVVGLVVGLVVGGVGKEHCGLFAPFVQQYLPFPPFVQQSGLVAPFVQQYGPRPEKSWILIKT
jgi:hypothetical protein